MAFQYNRIVVAVDGSKTAEAAFKKAVDIALLNDNAKLFIVHVIDTSSAKMLDILYQNMYDLMHEHARVLLDSYKLMAEEAGIKEIETVAVKGSPRTILSKDLGTIADADLIVCGKTGVGQIEHILIGSTTEAILHNAKCDVLIVENPTE